MKFRNELLWYSKMDEKSEYFESIMTWKRCERIWKLRTVSKHFKSGRKISQSWITSAVKFKKCRVIEENAGKYDDRGKRRFLFLLQIIQKVQLCRTFLRNVWVRAQRWMQNWILRRICQKRFSIFLPFPARLANSWQTAPIWLQKIYITNFRYGYSKNEVRIRWKKCRLGCLIYVHKMLIFL
jgi:hypothetical protein